MVCKDKRLQESLVFYLKFFGVLVAIGLVIIVPIVLIGNSKTEETTPVEESKPAAKTITLAEAKNYTGKTLSEFCDKYSGYTGYKLIAGVNGTNCTDVKDYPSMYNRYIITQVYKEEDPEKIKEYTEGCKHNDSYCKLLDRIFIEAELN